MASIEKLDLHFDVTAAKQALDQSHRWGLIDRRIVHPQSPHREVTDIWVRYKPGAEIDAERFTSDWYYPELTKVLQPMADALIEAVGGTELGAIFVSRIPAGKQVYPHKDGGWHAGYYSKYGICVAANKTQAFCFNDAELRTQTGDVFWFDNSQVHWVTNESDEDRITMITCVRTPRGIHEP